MIARLAIVVAVAGCAGKSKQLDLRPEDLAGERIVLAPTFELYRLDDSTWIHTTYKELPEIGLVLSNGLMLRGDGGVVLIDTPWTPEATRLLTDWVDTRLAVPVTDVIVTHAHDDRMGGLKELAPSTRVHALGLTSAIAAKAKLEFTAAPIATPQAELTLSGEPLVTFYPGAGHSPDNLLVWVPRHQVLFGGCFLRATIEDDLGNLADADVPAWAQSIRRAEAWAATLGNPGARVIVLPSHGELGGLRVLEHTRQLVDRVAARQ